MKVQYDYAKTKCQNIPWTEVRYRRGAFKTFSRFPVFWDSLKTAFLFALFQWAVACIGWLSFSTNVPVTSDNAGDIADFLDWQVAVTAGLFLMAIIIGIHRQRAVRDKL